MPSFSTFTKAANLQGGLGRGNTRDKLRNLTGKLSSASSIINDFISPPPGEGVAFSGSTFSQGTKSDSQAGKANNLADSKLLVFPENLGTSEYPAWVEITIFKRKALNAKIADAATEVKKQKVNQESDENSGGFGGFGNFGGLIPDSVSAQITSTLNETIAGVSTIATASRAKDDLSGTVAEPILVVCLPIQSGMGTDDLSTDIGAEQLGSIGGAVLENGLAGTLTLEKLFTAGAAKNLATATAFKTPFVGNSLKIMSGSVTNPYSYQMFNGVSHRAFNLTWNIAPLSSEESNKFLKIKEALSYHMLPENNGFLLTTPEEFKIRYMKLDQNGNPEVNPFYPRSMSCYLQNVNYLPNDQDDVVHADGAPITSQLQLNFQEIEVLDKNRLREGNKFYRSNSSIRDDSNTNNPNQ